MCGLSSGGPGQPGAGHRSLRNPPPAPEVDRPPWLGPPLAAAATIGVPWALPPKLGTAQRRHSALNALDSFSCRASVLQPSSIYTPHLAGWPKISCHDPTKEQRMEGIETAAKTDDGNAGIESLQASGGDERAT